MANKKKKSSTQLCELKSKSELLARKMPIVHQYSKNKFVCDTDRLGFANPDNRSPTELLVHASEGFIPLWEEKSILRWKFDRDSLALLKYPTKVKDRVRWLLSKALAAWGDAVPVRFSENEDVSDFEISIRDADKCSMLGCTLASAFFPDSGQHEFVIYPKMFEQSEEEQIETMAHELGHIFGLRHFFAKIKEQRWPAEIFGDHEKFTIMNYGSESVLTNTDREDLRTLYCAAWSGELQEINETPIRLFKPFHTYA